MPKVLKSCPHSYCEKCLLEIKEKRGKAMCPVCTNANGGYLSAGGEPEELPNNEQLIKAIDFKVSEHRAIQLMHRYEMLNPSFQARLAHIPETLSRKYPPHQLELSELISSDNEVVYLEHIAKSIHPRSPYFAITSNKN